MLERLKRGWCYGKCGEETHSHDEIWHDDAGELLLIYFRFGLFFCLNLGIDVSAELLRIETQNYADNYGSARQGYIIHYFWVLWDVEVYLCKI